NASPHPDPGRHSNRPSSGPGICSSPASTTCLTTASKPLGRVLADRPELEAAWRMLQHLYGIHLAEDSDEANQALGAFIDIWNDTPLVEFDRLVETLLEWGDEIFAFHDTDRINNGRIEGTNNRLG